MREESRGHDRICRGGCRGDRPGTRMRRWRVKRLQVEYPQNASRDRGSVCEGKKGEEEVYERENVMRRVERKEKRGGGDGEPVFL